MPREITDIIIDYVYGRECAELDDIVEAVVRELSKQEEEVKHAVVSALSKLVRKRLLIRKRRGYYCVPPVVIL